MDVSYKSREAAMFHAAEKSNRRQEACVVFTVDPDTPWTATKGRAPDPDAVFYDDHLIWSVRPLEDRVQNYFGVIPITATRAWGMIDDDREGGRK